MCVHHSWPALYQIAARAFYIAILIAGHVAREIIGYSIRQQQQSSSRKTNMRRRAQQLERESSRTRRVNYISRKEERKIIQYLQFIFKFTALFFFGRSQGNFHLMICDAVKFEKNSASNRAGIFKKQGQLFFVLLVTANDF